MKTERDIYDNLELWEESGKLPKRITGKERIVLTERRRTWIKALEWMLSK